MMKTKRNRHGFFMILGLLLDILLQPINLLFSIINDSRPYKLDWKHILSEYDKSGEDDVCQFAYDYVLLLPFRIGKSSDEINWELLSTQIIEGIVKRRRNVV